MDINTLRVFLCATDTLNFSRTSEELHMSLSAVSRSIQRLEDELGQRLLERNNRSMRLTHSGKVFRDYAKRALADWQHLRQQLGSDTELVGKMSLFGSVTANYNVLAPILDAFRKAYPAVEVVIHAGDQADGISRVLSGQDDVAVTGKPDQLPERLTFLPLHDSPLVFCVPADDCAVRETIMGSDIKSPKFDWSTVPFIIPQRGITKDLVEQWFRSQSIRPHIYAEVAAGHEGIVAMVGLGLGVGFAPQLVIDTSGIADKISTLVVKNELPSLTVGLCCLKQRLDSPLVRSFWNIAEKARNRD